MKEIKNIGEFMEVAESLEYRYAKTYANTNPHEYCYAYTPELKDTIRALNKYIQDYGEKEMFYKRSN